jgi:hypothetical protein
MFKTLSPQPRPARGFSWTPIHNLLSEPTVADRFAGQLAHPMVGGLSSDRFPSPWRAEKVPGGYAVRDAEGKIVAHVFGQSRPIRGGPAILSLDDAKEMAGAIAELPELWRTVGW